MKNFIFTSFMCLISIAVFSQEKTRTISNQDTIQRISNTKPVLVNTGNPAADQERYDSAKAKYISENPGVVSSTTSTTTTDTPTAIESKEEIAKKIQQIDSHINSINIKSKAILNDPEQKRIAEQEGWFEDMKATKERLELKKQDLQKTLEQ